MRSFVIKWVQLLPLSWSAGSVTPTWPPSSPMWFVCPYWHLFQVRQLRGTEPESQWPVTCPSAVSFLVPSLVSLEERRTLESGLHVALVGRSAELPCGFVPCPRDKEGEKPLRHCRCSVQDVRLGLLAALQIPLWTNFCFPFLLGGLNPLLNLSLSSSLYCQDFGKIGTVRHCCWGCEMVQPWWEATWQYSSYINV